MRHRLLLLGMPRWDVLYPFHALAYVAGIVRRAGWTCSIEDVNIKTYRLVSPEDRIHWDAHHAIWHEHSISDLLLKKYESLIQRILEDALSRDQYDLIAFTVTSQSRNMTLWAAQYFKSVDIDLPILFGGADCFPTEHHTQFFAELGGPDIICQGEAEIAMVRFLREFAVTGEFTEHIPGFVYVQNGKIIDTGEPELPHFESDIASPDWSQFDFVLYERPGDITTFMSRGCPNRCAFCNSRINYKRYRFRTAESVVDEIRAALPFAAPYSQTPTIHFSELLINGNIRELERFCELIIESGLCINWEGLAWFRPGMTRRLLAKMKRAGCSALVWGFESGSQRVLNLMGKNYSHEMARRILGDAADLGIENYLPIIVGFPGEQVEDYVKTVEFVIQFEKRAQFLGPSVLTLDRGSPIYERYGQWGLRNHDSEYWTTNDNMNDLSVRKFRQFVLCNVIRNHALSLHDIVAEDALEQIDLNTLSVASEIAGLLYELWKHNGTDRAMSHIFSGIKPNVSPPLDLSEAEHAYWHPRNIPNAIPLNSWFKADKNSEEHRLMICNFLFEALRNFRAVTVEQPTSERGLYRETDESVLI
jgi:anaerobic magnesium-protoporphyrin IX monomethyl ester cyclase